MTEINRNPNDAGKGIDTRKFLISIAVVMVLIFMAAFFVVGTHQNTLMRGITHPKPTSATTPE